MKIYHFGGTAECKSIEELSSILDLRYGTGVNEFLIAGENKFPYLAIIVNNEYAALTFVSEDEDFLFQAIGGNIGLNLDETSVFYTGTQDQETQVWNEFVVPFTKAKEVAIEFFNSLTLPTCIEWSKQ